MEELIAKYLADELSEKERVEFEQRLIQNDNLASELELSLNAWQAVRDSKVSSFDTGTAWKHVSQQVNQAQTVSLFEKPRYTLLKIAATLLILISAGYFAADYTGIFNGSPALTELQTFTNYEEFELPDGSFIKLKANSSITYAKGFGQDHRELKLNGGANFDVSRNEQIPFIIRTEKSVVKVLGTTFDLSAYPDKAVELHVSEGLVNFTALDQEDTKHEVAAGKRAVLLESNEIITEDLTNNNYAAWWTGQLVFNNTPLGEVVKDLESAFSVSITLKDQLKDCKLNASYSKSSIEEIAQLIQATLVDSEITITFTKENALILDGKACTN